MRKQRSLPFNEADTPFVESWLKGRSQVDVAREFGVSVARVRQRLFRAARRRSGHEYLVRLPSRDWAGWLG